MAVVGDKELEDGAVSVRRHGEGDVGTASVEELIRMIAPL
jgi:threonyl-tRNA synthetase